MKINKKVPLPDRKVSGTRVYPLVDMEVDDSFEVPLEYRKRVSAAASAYGKRAGKKFVTRTVQNEDGEWVAGVWRTK